MTTSSFTIVVQDMYGPILNRVTLDAEVHVMDGNCEIRNKRTGDIIQSTTSLITVYEALGFVQDQSTWGHYMFFSQKPSYVDGHDGYFSAIDKDTEIFVTMCDRMEDLVSLPVSSIHGGTFCIYPRANTARSLSEAIRLAKLNNPTLLEDDDIGTAHAPFAAPYEEPNTDTTR